MMDRLLKFWTLTWRERLYFCEASVLLLLSALCVKTIAFRHIDNFLRGHWNDCTNGTFDAADEIEIVNRSLSRATKALPWKSLCLSRSIAAFIMLRRRGIPAAMVAGVKFAENSSLLAHAWIQTELGVIDANPQNSVFTAVVRIGQETLIGEESARLESRHTVQ
jgi:hypothetical protein